MSKLYLGKINLKKIDKTKIFDGKDGNKWIDITVWVDDENPDKYGNHLKVQQSTKKDEATIYLGEAKKYEKQEQQITPNQNQGLPEEEESLPF